MTLSIAWLTDDIAKMRNPNAAATISASRPFATNKRVVSPARTRASFGDGPSAQVLACANTTANGSSSTSGGHHPLAGETT